MGRCCSQLISLSILESQSWIGSVCVRVTVTTHSSRIGSVCVGHTLIKDVGVAAECAPLFGHPDQRSVSQHRHVLHALPTLSSFRLCCLHHCVLSRDQTRTHLTLSHLKEEKNTLVYASSVFTANDSNGSGRTYSCRARKL